MKHKNDQMGIEFKNPLYHKLIPYIILVMLALSFIINDISFDVGHWAFWIFLALGMFFIQATPDYVLYDEGIEIKLGWLCIFVEWENVQSAYEEEWKTRIYIRQKTLPSLILKLCINPGVGIISQAENYDFVLQVFKERLGKRYFGGTRKKR